MKDLMRVFFVLVFMGQALPVFAQMALRYETTARGDITVIGSSLGYDCAATTPAPRVGVVNACGTNVADSAPDVYWRSDSPVAGQAEASTAISNSDARTTAVLGLPVGAEVLQAWLYWSASRLTGDPDDPVATLGRPGVFASELVASECWGVGTAWQCGANVTDEVRAYGSGPFRVSGVLTRNLQSLNSSVEYAAWSLVVAWRLPSEPLRHLQWWDGLVNVIDGAPMVFDVDGFVVPPVGASSRLSFIAYDGDVAASGDGLRVNGTALSNATNPADNVFNGSRSLLGVAVSVPGDLPQTTGSGGSMSGLDIDVFDISAQTGPGASTLQIAADTIGDVYQVGLVAFAISTVAPSFEDATLRVEGVSSGAILPGDRLAVTIDIQNQGFGEAMDVVVAATLPASLVLAPESIQVRSSPNDGAFSDASGDDPAEYDPARRAVRVRLGRGSDASSGGALSLGEGARITFEVVAAEDFLGESELQAFVSAAGNDGAVYPLWGTGTAPSDGVAEPTPFTVVNCATDDNCSGTTPFCRLDVPFGRCVACTDSAQCSGSSPVCDASIDSCRECLDSSECGEETPYCFAGGRCVECVPGLAGSCAGDTPFCDPLLIECVGCRSSDDCTDDAPVCGLSRTCGPCGNDTDCGAVAPLCNTSTGACVTCLTGREFTCDATCGDGVPVDVQEECDDGNRIIADGCDADCFVEIGWYCSASPTGSSTCTADCGDGQVAEGIEECDDANGTPDDGCTGCDIDSLWVCDGSPSVCSELQRCGDRIVQAGELCDDGDNVPGDGCDSLCALEEGFACPTPGEPCSPDRDSDGISDDIDSCPDVWDPSQSDEDGDDVGDVCDECPTAAGEPEFAGCSAGSDDVGVTDAEDDAGDADVIEPGDVTDVTEPFDAIDAIDMDAAASDAAEDDSTASHDTMADDATSPGPDSAIADARADGSTVPDAIDEPESAGDSSGCGVITTLAPTPTAVLVWACLWLPFMRRRRHSGLSN